MWHRWTNREVEISSPTLIETTLEDNYLETIPEVESVRSKRSSNTMTLPELPFRAMAATQEKESDQRKHNRHSSVYSQPSPIFLPHEYHEDVPKSMPGPGDVSPISTPRTSGNFAASDVSLISPIESTFTIPPKKTNPLQSFRSQIPVPISTVPSSKPVIKHAPPRKKGQTKWDEYSGEPTEKEDGKPPTIRPGQTPLDVQFPQLKERTRQILVGLRERDIKNITKKRPWGKAPPPVETDVNDRVGQLQAEECVSTRTSGESGIIETATAMSFDRNARISRIDFTQSQQYPISRDDRTPSPIQPVEPAETEKRDTYPILNSDQSVRVTPSAESLKPVVPLKVSNSYAKPAAHPDSPSQLQSPFRSPRPQPSSSQQRDTLVHDLVTKPSPELKDERSHSNSPSSPGTPTPTSTTFRNQQGHQYPDEARLEHEPVSRFSWTTYATTVNDSPTSVTPTRAEFTSRTSSLPSPIMMRRRPVSTAAGDVLSFSNTRMRDSSATLISRKPLNTDRLRSASGTALTAKSLPPTPVEMSAGSKKEVLEARMDDLASRKRNNNKIVWELKESLKKNAIEYDNRKRKEIEKMMSKLRSELDEIKREEHDVGLLLHRAQKKEDEEDGYEKSGGLWIKRVTS